MSNQPDHPNQLDQSFQQDNHASNGGTLYANQGTGKMSVRNRYSVDNKRRSWAGWAILVALVVDVGFFLYASAAYTGRPGDSGDLVRAGIAILLLAITVSLIRRWFRSR